MQQSLKLAVEQRDSAGRGKQDHSSGAENSRRGLEHTNKAYLEAQTKDQKPGFEMATEISELDIATRAYQLWQDRCCPDGSPDKDWFRALEEIHARR